MTVSKSVRMLAASASAAMLVVLVNVGQHVRATQATDQLIRGPADWVPLTFELTHSVDGVPLFQYVTYRAANGSTRRDRQDGEFTEILNLATGKYYELNMGKWFEHPARPQPAAGKPFIVLNSSRLVEVPPSDPRVQGLAHVGIPLTFYEMGRGTPDVKVFCPELNLLEVWAMRPSRDKIAEFKVTNLWLGEPPVEFSPPRGIQVVSRSDAAGPGRVSRTPSGVQLRPPPKKP